MNEAQTHSHKSASPLLNSKLMRPRPHAGVLERRDLFRHLDRGLARKLTLVCAPTGFGKTTLVSTWLANREFPSAWITLDKNDNDPIRFWTYFASAVRSLDPRVGKATLSALMTSQPQSLESLLTPLVNDLALLQAPSVLVLEDFHFITSTDAQDSLWFLLQHLPEPLHILLITRSEPALPIATLRAHDDLVDLDANSLRMTAEDVRAYTKNSLPTELSAEAINTLLERTDGWPAGVRLMTLTWNREPVVGEEIGRGLSRGDRYVSDYLLREVFDTQPAGTQAFLLKTCFFGRLTGSLADRITGARNGASELERLEHDNLFVSRLERSADQQWYRYGSLFAEALQHAATQRLAPGDIEELFAAASSWYEANGLDEEAIETALSAKLFDRALELIERFIEFHEISELLTLRRWLQDIPAQNLMKRPLVCFAYAQIILYTDDRYSPATAARIEPLLQAAQSAWQAENNGQRLGELLSIRGTIAWWQGDMQRAFDYARQSLEMIPEQDVLYRGSSLLIVSRTALDSGKILAAQDMALEARALMGAAQNIHGVLAAIQMLAEVAFWQGELEQAVQLNEHVLNNAIGGEEMLDDKGIASLGLADVAYERNDLHLAEERASEALELGKRRGNEKLEVLATIRMAQVRAAQMNIPAGLDLLRSLAGRMRNGSFLRDAQAEQARLSIRAGETLSLAGWAAIASAQAQNINTLQREREAFALARLHIAEGAPEGALQALRGWSDDASNNGRVRSQVEARLLEALACYGQSNLSDALQPLHAALKLGQEKGFRRLFLDEGPQLAALIKDCSNRLDDRGTALYAAGLLQLLGSATPSQPAGAPVEALSQQEIRVLRLLAAGLSNPDIARELVVSPNTVKTHVKSIYRKLGVASRADARDVARNLRLI